MGGSLLEAATLVDLQFDTNQACTSATYRQATGWHVPGYTFEQIVAGHQHVDDALLISRLLCSHCMFEALKATWPSDVGVSIEEQARLIRF